MDFETLRAQLFELKQKQPCGVIIPLHEKDLGSPAIPIIVKALNKCDYLTKVFVALSASDRTNYNKAKELFSDLKIPTALVWCNRPEVNTFLEEAKAKGLDITRAAGKGKDLWITIGIASLELYAFAVHDADIITYSEMIPTKLLYTVIDPRTDFFFSKGYYVRLNSENKTMYGRIHRLFINPLLEALQKKLNQSSDFVRYLQAFRYSLSGEMAIYSDLALNLRLPEDWGLELGTLSELYRNASTKRICEVDLGIYDHKHKKIAPEALIRTAEDALITLLRTLTETEGIDVSEAFLLSLQVTYRRFAQDRIRQYHADALCNGLVFDRHGEETTVDALSEVIIRAGMRYLKNPIHTQLPDWLRMLSAMPDARERLRSAAVEP
jgi:glucosyl-3-phosphoglycerate synthase